MLDDFQPRHLEGLRTWKRLSLSESEVRGGGIHGKHRQLRRGSARGSVRACTQLSECKCSWGGGRRREEWGGGGGERLIHGSNLASLEDVIC